MKLNCKECLKGNCRFCNDEDCLCYESHNKNELKKIFTDSMYSLLPSSVEELKRILRENVESDEQEFQDESTSKFEIYEEMNNLQAYGKDFVYDIMLPAHQFNGKKSCGQWKVLGCMDHDGGGHGFIRKTEQHCNHRGCRKCWVNSVNREAKSITDRIVTFCNLKNNTGVYQKKIRKRVPLHVIVSLPKEKYHLMSSKKGRQEVRRFVMNGLLKLDIDGGVIFDHPYRFTEDKTSAYLSPHFHCIVTGWIDGKTVSRINSETGLIIKNTSPLTARKNVYNLSKYLLSHTATYMKEIGKRSPEHSIRYFGECQNRKFKVDSVLKYSKSGYDQLDELMINREIITKRINKTRVTIPLQRVTFTHSIIKDEIKESENELFVEYCNGNMGNLTKSLRNFISPLIDQYRDNPASCESDPRPMEFLQMRFDYGYSQFNIVQSEYRNIILDGNLDDLCPECSFKMQVLVPLDRGGSEVHLIKLAELIKSLPLDLTLPLDDMASLFAYRKNQFISYKGLEYFDSEGMRQYDDGIYQKPDCLFSLNPFLYYSIDIDIEVQRFRNSVKTSLGRGMTHQERTEFNSELKEYVSFMKSKKSAYTKPLECFQ